MVPRRFWVARIEEAWAKRTVIWLSGVRRSGKTVLTQSLEGVEYFDCELPRTRRLMDDPEGFLGGLRKKRVVLDEIHRLQNPAELLKIAADHFGDVHVIATGSSTLSASAKFRDTLTGRKAEIWLTPMMSADLTDFGRPSIPHRLLHGGLPPFFLSREIPEREFQEWIDGFWAKDVQELFRLERKASFQRFLELVLAQSGGMFEATAFAGPCEVSRGTIVHYLEALAATRVAHVIRPFSTRRSTEIVAAPRVYGFDTGFVAYFRGWNELRSEDRGALWEHYVLNEIHSRVPGAEVRYWRDKKGHEVDFVVVRRGRAPIAIECKWSADRPEPAGLTAFRRFYPKADAVVASADVDRTIHRDLGAAGKVDFVSLETLVDRLS
jgi:uncharacterized protein